MTTTAASYHHATSYNRFEMGGHRMDWGNQPDVYKRYRDTKSIPLPRSMELPRITLEELASLSQQQPDGRKPITIDRLSAILALSYGVTGHLRSGGEDFYYRSAPSAGALYPVEIYLAVENIDSLEPGLYHYDVSKHGLSLLRPENIMPFADACMAKSETAPPPHICFFFSAIIFRSAWKYKKRAYRYLLLDTGHAIENLLMAVRAEGLSATVHYDVHKEKTDHLLGLDPNREICFACVRIAGRHIPDPDIPKKIADLPRSIKDAGRVAAEEESFTAIEEMSLAAAVLPTHGQTVSDMTDHLALFPERWQRIQQSRNPFPYDFSDAALRRRSRRNFTSDELSGDSFYGLLSFLSRMSTQENSVSHPFGSAVSTGLLVQNVEDVTPGYYLCDFQKNRWGQLRPGQLCAGMAAACLDQQWLQNAAVHFCFLANLDRLDRTWGSRGYQYAMLDAGRTAQWIYLAATALGLGCCGIGALYDDEARGLLGLDKSTALLYLVAAGPVKPY